MTDVEFVAAIKEMRGDVAASLSRWLVITQDQARDPFGLTGPERMAIWLYTSFNIWHQRINFELWSGVVSAPVEVIAAALAAALQKLPKYHGLAFRGVPLFASQNVFAAHYRPRQLIEWPAFSSAARIRQEAFRAKALFVIQAVNARSIQGYGADGDQSEVIFAPNSRFIVLAQDQSDSQIIVELQEISDEPAS